MTCATEAVAASTTGFGGAAECAVADTKCDCYASLIVEFLTTRIASLRHRVQLYGSQ